MFTSWKKATGLALLFIFGVVITVVGSSAQNEKKNGGSNVSVTGCLQKGDEAGEYMITGEDGKMYGLRSSSVKLGEHVGHKVTVSGNLKAEEHENEAKESKEGAEKEAGDIKVSKLKMVSESCK